MDELTETERAAAGRILELGDPATIPPEVWVWARERADRIRAEGALGGAMVRFMNAGYLREEANTQFPGCKWAIPLVRMMITDTKLGPPPDAP